MVTHMRLTDRMGKILLLLGLLLCCFASGCTSVGHRTEAVTQPPDRRASAAAELPLSNIRQFTFAGRRSGEGYFSPDGRKFIFQSEREPGNPFFQIYLMDMENGRTRRLSPGWGKTTCGWIHPFGKNSLFASTHEDPRAREKQKVELDERAAGEKRRYAWDYDEHFDIYEVTLDTGKLTNLTNVRGYDAEGAYSPDGTLIVFASNRHAYTDPLNPSDRDKFEIDKSYLIDIYLMNADPAGPPHVRRLTTTKGYDGGPFFAPNGRRICWRRFDADGTRAEVFTMKLDGSDQRQITRLGAMSWAPFYHPSGDYLIFTTNLLGFANFELYIVDVDGQQEPVRVTSTEGFDGLPVFTPDGHRLCWTSKRGHRDGSQLFTGDWNDRLARRLLGIDGPTGQWRSVPTPVVKTRTSGSSAAITQHEIREHIRRMAGSEMEGRLTGTRGEQLATAYVAKWLRNIGMEPAGDNGTFFQPFRFTSGVSLGPKNKLVRHDADGVSKSYRPDQDWRPLAFSGRGRFEPAPLIFAGYGIKVPEGDTPDSVDVYDSYVHLDVKDKWVLVLRYLPDDITAEHRQALSRYSGLRYKAMTARDLGARGLIVVSGPHAQVKGQLVKMQFDATLAGTSIATISVTNELAQQWLDPSGKDLGQLQQQLDTGQLVMGFELDGIQVGATIDIPQVKRTGRNVLARLRAAGGHDGIVLVGAHIDHLGQGIGPNSLATGEDDQAIHYGADDNASGVAAVLEIAQNLADRQASGKLKLKRDVLFAAWSGEELGLLGSSHFARRFFPEQDDDAKLYPAITAYVNLDMVGRYEKGLILSGFGSSHVWPHLIERANVPVGLKIIPQNDNYVPTDATTFYVKGVPSLGAFTGAHRDYHTPRDTPDKINYPDTQRVTELLAQIVFELATADQPPDYIATGQPRGPSPRGMRVYLGTIPDYSESDVKGLKLSGVGSNGPAERAGIKGGDVVVELAGRNIENIYDYTYAIEALKVGQPVDIVVLRKGKRLKLEIIPGSRE